MLAALVDDARAGIEFARRSDDGRSIICLGGTVVRKLVVVVVAVGIVAEDCMGVVAVVAVGVGNQSLKFERSCCRS